jgi:hypothetical protein
MTQGTQKPNWYSNDGHFAYAVGKSVRFLQGEGDPQQIWRVEEQRRDTVHVSNFGDSYFLTKESGAFITRPKTYVENPAIAVLAEKPANVPTPDSFA